MKFFKNDVSEKMRDEYLKSLVDKGYSKDEVAKRLDKAATWVSERFQLEVARTFSDEDLARWEKFTGTGPTQAQEWIVLEQFYKTRTGKDFQDLFTEVWGNYFIWESIEIQKENERRFDEEVRSKLSKLSNKQKKQFEKYLDAKDVESATKLLNGVEEKTEKKGFLSWFK